MALQNKTSSTSTSSKDSSLSSHLPLLKFHNFSPELYEQKQAQKIKKKRKSFTVNKNQLEPVNKITNIPNTRPLESSFQYHANHHYQQHHHHSQILPPHHHFIANTAELPQSIALPPALTILPSTSTSTPVLTPVVSIPISGAALVPHAVVSVDDQKKIFKMQLKNIMNDNDLPRPLHRSKNYHLNGDSMIDEDDEDEEEFADNEQDLNCHHNNNNNNHNNQKQQFGSFDNSAFRLKESKRNYGPNLNHLDPNFTIPVTHTLYHIECASDTTIQPNFPDRMPMERGTTGRGNAFLPNELVQ